MVEKAALVGAPCCSSPNLPTNPSCSNYPWGRSGGSRVGQGHSSRCEGNLERWEVLFVMCFFSSPDPPKQTPAPTPAPAAPAPSLSASTAMSDVGSTRRSEDVALFGSGRQSLRVDRSATSGGIGRGGSGIKV